MDDIIDLIKWAIGSTYLKEYDSYEIEPICYMFVAKSGGGKSFSMEQFEKGDKYDSEVVFTEDEWTYVDVFNKIYEQIKKGKKLMFTKDFSQMIQRMSSTVRRLMGVLLKITERKGLYQIKDKSGLTRDIVPLKLSFITGITPQTLDKNITNWYDSGLINRLILISWRLNAKQERVISKHKAEKYASKSKNKYKTDVVKLNYKKMSVTISKKLCARLESCAIRANQRYFNYYLERNRYFEYLYYMKNKKEKDEDKNILADFLSRGMSEEEMEIYRSSYIRLYEKFVTIARGKALTEGREKVSEKDIDEVIRILDKYCNLDFNLVGDEK